MKQSEKATIFSSFENMFLLEKGTGHKKILAVYGLIAIQIYPARSTGHQYVHLSSALADRCKSKNRAPRRRSTAQVLSVARPPHSPSSAPPPKPSLQTSISPLALLFANAQAGAAAAGGNEKNPHHREPQNP
jgi:hypothetical protein